MKKIFLVFVMLFLIVSSVFSQTINIKIEKMHCPLCTMMIKKAITKVDGVENVKVTLHNKMAQVKYDESKITDIDILKAIETTSYTGVVQK
jgi:mercuric ion binding protein